MMASAFVAMTGFIKVTGGLPGGTVNLNGSRKHEPKSVSNVEKTCWYSRRTLPKSLMTDGDQP